MKVSHLLLSIPLLTMILLILPPSSSSQDFETLEGRFLTANEAYSSGRYDEAMSEYTNLIEEFGFSAALLYNLGNSYAQKGQSGLAILQYLRGLQLSPGNSDIQGNLELIRKNSGIFTEAPTFKEKIFTLFDLNQWAIIILVAIILCAALFILNSFIPMKKGLITGLSLLLGTAIIFSLLGIMQQRIMINGAVVIAPETRLLMSPFETASAQGTLQQGSVVLSENKHGEYALIRDRRGRSGWIPSTSLEPINISKVKIQMDK